MAFDVELPTNDEIKACLDADDPVQAMSALAMNDFDNAGYRKARDMIEIRFRLEEIIRWCAANAHCVNAELLMRGEAQPKPTGPHLRLVT